VCGVPWPSFSTSEKVSIPKSTSNTQKSLLQLRDVACTVTCHQSGRFAWLRDGTSVRESVRSPTDLITVERCSRSEHHKLFLNVCETRFPESTRLLVAQQERTHTGLGTFWHPAFSPSRLLFTTFSVPTHSNKFVQM
jgi:hypothetical protein